MIASIYVNYNDDSYQVDVNTDTESIVIIWRYRFNRPSRPEPVSFDNLSLELQLLIDHKVLQTHGFTAFPE